ncbi:activating signal cointegrator 1 isoform X2 [Corvus moneduloides]|uniref:Activating signal cointegrator 1 n=2 Tax=Corvus moneduloides TaxID=1196302 RepID=A0A8C3E561_CORMO|nr:activating signal cointegrator 1 isoform X2 [Corvus moneduloides]
MAAPSALLAWCVQHLRGDFGLDVGEEVVRYILSITNEDEIREYVVDLVQGTEGKKSWFVEELLARWRKSAQLPSEPFPVYRKKDEVLRAGDQGKKGKRKGRNKQETPAYTEPSVHGEEVKTPLDLAKAQESSSGVGSSSISSKKKPKFVSLYTREGQDRLAVLIPGRHACECLGQKHRLINNCLECGHIVCEQEGSGPCLFCGALVCTKEEQDILQRDSSKSQKLLKKLMAGAENSGNLDAISKGLLPRQEARLKSGLEMAVKHKDKLLEFDRTSVRRTQVIDDESDYFATDSNQWLSKQEREALQKREQELRELRHASRLAKKITIDFAGRQILEEDNNMAEYHSKLDETIEAMSCGALSEPAGSPRAEMTPNSGVLVNPRLLQPAPLWVDQTGLLPQRKTIHSMEAGSESGLERSRLRIQDRELQEISDDGWCLSLHQPWASLLVRGIKRVEGRTWYTSHRGRLWIAATAKRPSPQEICELEATYRMLLRKDVEFPSDYPSGCLLGCVDVTDCLSQEQFQEQYPDLSQESGSPFVFICTNPQEMVLKFPIKGKHKIWKLDAKIHQGAKKGLMKQKAVG